MKDTFRFPKTLRNYHDQPSKQTAFVNSPHLTKSYKSLSSCHRKKTVQQEQHNVDNIGDYYVLTNPSQFKSKQYKPKKNKQKSKSKESHFSQALKQQLSKPMISYNQVGPQNILHCKSLQKLQIISNDRSEQIKALMNEKGLLMAQNEDLRAKLANPTYREQDFIQKIAQREFQIQNLKQNLRRKEELICEIEKDHKMEIERLKVKHRQEMANLREEMNKLRLEGKNQSPKRYVTHTSTNNQRVYKPETFYNSYNPVIESKTSNAVNSGSYRVVHQESSPTVLNPTTYNSTYKSLSSNTHNKSPKRSSSNDTKQPFKTYIGEDGYERRVYQRTVDSNDYVRTSLNQNPNKLENPNPIQTIRYSTSSNNLSNVPSFTNQKITTYVPKQNPSTTNVYKYSEASNQKSSGQYVSGLHNQNLYSKSLTFQCFNDFN